MNALAIAPAASFAAIGLIEPLQRALLEHDYREPTPIQSQAIPPLLGGRDLLGCANTGTGRTAAFALPILQQIAALAAESTPAQRGAPLALVLVPTRELAAQVAESFESYGRHLPVATAVVYGGVGQGPQVRALMRGAEVVVATPGRLLDLMNQGYVRLDRVRFFVLDEADHMLDLGFLPEVRRIVAKVPRQRQTLLLSATMPPPIAALAEQILVDPVKVFVSPAASTVDAIEERLHFVEAVDKPALLGRLLADEAVGRALVFTRTKRGADRVAQHLTQSGIRAQAIHGNESQNDRERSLAGFRRGSTRVLVATDLAARGLDVADITHVFNFELPNVPETYVNRIGRAGRAGATGVAVSFCATHERPFLRDIERLVRRKVAAAAGSSRPHPAAPARAVQTQRASHHPRHEVEACRRAEPGARPHHGRWRR